MIERKNDDGATFDFDINFGMFVLYRASMSWPLNNGVQNRKMLFGQFKNLLSISKVEDLQI